MRLTYRALCAPLLGALASGGAVAQPVTAANDGLIEIVVTAQRVAQAESNVPLAVSALTGEQLRERNYDSLEDFKGAVPGLQVNNYAGEARINIRGIGMNSLSFGVDSQVAFSLNGVYLSSARVADQAFLDVERIEVVRGPQGTLYGRNATGGAINVITNRPKDEFESWVQLSYGNYNDIASKAVLSGPLVGDTVLGRLAISTENHDGYALNLYNGKYYDNANTQTVRGTLVFNFSPDLTLDLIADFHRAQDGDNAGHLIGESPGFPILTGVTLGGHTVPLDSNGQAIDPRLLNINTIPLNDQKSWGAAADLTWKIDQALTLKSITGFRKENVQLTLDFDETETPFDSTVPGKDFAGYEGDRQISEEVQLLGNYARVNFVSGLYYFNDKVDPGYFWLGLNFGTPSFPFVNATRLGGTTTTDAYAAFGEATFKATDKLNLTAGVRYSHEKRSATSLEMVPSFDLTVTDAASKSFHDVSPKFSIDYHFTDGLMTYLTISKGFQSGGFDISAQPPLVAFEPETVWDYEAGLKWRTKQVSVDLSAFHYDYTNLQVAQIVNGLPATTNAADSKIDGAELEATVQATPAFQITEALAYLHARFTKFTEMDTLTGELDDLAGNQLPGAPKWSSNLLLNYSVPIAATRLSLTGEWNWHDRLYFTEFNSAQVSQAPTSTYNASARLIFNHEKTYLELYGKNLSNELVLSQAWITGAGFGSMVLGHIAPPRTYGVLIHHSFN